MEHQFAVVTNPPSRVKTSLLMTPMRNGAHRLIVMVARSSRVSGGKLERIGCGVKWRGVGERGTRLTGRYGTIRLFNRSCRLARGTGFFTTKTQSHKGSGRLSDQAGRGKVRCVFATVTPAPWRLRGKHIDRPSRAQATPVSLRQPLHRLPRARSFHITLECLRDRTTLYRPAAARRLGQRPLAEPGHSTR
jgi:hypothetical protein